MVPNRLVVYKVACLAPTIMPPIYHVHKSPLFLTLMLSTCLNVLTYFHVIG